MLLSAAAWTLSCSESKLEFGLVWRVAAAAAGVLGGLLLYEYADFVSRFLSGSFDL